MLRSSCGVVADCSMRFVNSFYDNRYFSQELSLGLRVRLTIALTTVR